MASVPPDRATRRSAGPDRSAVDASALGGRKPQTVARVDRGRSPAASQLQPTLHRGHAHLCGAAGDEHLR